MINALMLTLGILIGVPLGIYCAFKKSTNYTTAICKFKRSGKTFYVYDSMLTDGFILMNEAGTHSTMFDKNGRFKSNIDIDITNEK